jgi:Flp pilus assembly protein TadG
MTTKTSFPKSSRRNLAVLAEDGNSLVEMALACLVLIPILFGIIQLSIGLYCYHFAADAAREATRWAIVRGSTCNGLFGTGYCSPTSSNVLGADNADITQYVKSLGYPFSGKLTTTTQWCVNSGTVPATWTCSATQSSDPLNQVSVKVTYAYPLIIPFLKANTINLGSVSSMTIVQ